MDGEFHGAGSITLEANKHLARVVKPWTHSWHEIETLECCLSWICVILVLQFYNMQVIVCKVWSAIHMTSKFELYCLSDESCQNY